MGGQSDGIVGREAEVTRLRGALAAARAGRPSVALITGPAGIGRTALWRAALEPAPGTPPGPDDSDPAMPVTPHDGDLVLVTTTGDEAEAGLDHGVVDQLLWRAPLDVAGRAALAPPPGADPVEAGAALVGLVDRLAADRTLVVVVDDAQWADEPSLRALTFAARRLHDDRVLLCVACRDDGVDRVPTGLVRLAAEPTGVRLDLGPLDAGSVGELVRRAYGRPVPAAVAARLAAHAGGNPLHTRALLDEVPFEVLTSTATDSLPVPRSYASLVLAQVARCRPGARDMVAALAVLGTAAPVADLARMVGCDDPPAALDDLVACGLVEVATSTPGPVPAPGVVAPGTTVAFPHGLARAGILADLSPSRRSALHAAAAAVTDGDEALTHRLAAAVGPDPDLVADARERARALIADGVPTAAARHLLAAAPLAPGPGEREQLMVTAAAHLALAGQAGPALVADLAGLPPSALRSCVLGRAAMATGDQAAGERLLVDAWERAARAGPGDDAAAVAAPVADLLAILALHRRDGPAIVAWARRALATGSQSGLSAALSAHGLAIEGRLAEAIDEMSAILAADPPPVRRLDALLGRGIVRVWANDLEGAAGDLAAIEADTGAPRSTFVRVDVRSYRAEEAFRSGRWAEALDLAESTASIVDDMGDPMLVALPHGVAAFVLAGMGRLRGARAHVDAATANADETGLMPARLWSLHAALRLAAARADHAEVARLGDRLVADGYDALPEGVHHWRATYVDALEALGRLDDAAGVARELAGRSADGADASVAADAARAAGVVAAAQGRDGDAVAAFESGLALDVVASRPFERARLELAAGAHLRRAGNRRAAAALLGRALARFESLGAAPWATRCGREAAACGLRPRRRAQPDATGALTTQERLVARLVAQGGTNRDVAAELVISARTVEHHLGRVYAKLGLRSRTELAARLAADAAGGADPATGEAAGGHGEPGGDVGREGAP